MESGEISRQLVIIGGAEDKEGECIILREFVRRAGGTKTNPRMEVVKLGVGMGFLSGVAIDQHFLQRGRLGRLISALAQQPAVLGFGIDENTAVVVSNNQIEVIGEGAVTIVDESAVTHSNADEVLKDEPLAVCGARLHILPHGYKFDLKTRKPILS